MIEFLNKRLSLKFPVHLEDIDLEIESLAKEEPCRHHFEWAARKLKRNWGVPIKSRWLSLTD